MYMNMDAEHEPSTWAWISTAGPGRSRLNHSVFRPACLAS